MSDHILPKWADDMPACAGHPDPELWSYEYYRTKEDQVMQAYRIIEATDICHACPIKAACLQQGLRDENLVEGTIWGGLMFWERQQMTGTHAYKLQRGERDLQKEVRKAYHVLERRASA